MTVSGTLSTGEQQYKEDFIVADRDGILKVRMKDQVMKITVYEAGGRLVFRKEQIRQTEYQMPLPASKGVYIISAEDRRGKIIRKKIRKE